MSKADKMFEDLGYIKKVIIEDNCERCQYIKEQVFGNHIRTFDFTITSYGHKRVQIWGNMVVGVDEHLAIHEKNERIRVVIKW